MDASYLKWEKKSDSGFAFKKDENQIGEITIAQNAFEKKAGIVLNNNNYHLKHTGFWKNDIQIVDDSGRLVLKTYAEKWYSSKTIIAFEERQLKLIIRNNPMAEYVIMDGDKEILSYGLITAEKQIVTRIQTTLANKSYLLHFYLWYLFEPIARENMGDDLTFLLLLCA